VLRSARGLSGPQGLRGLVLAMSLLRRRLSESHGRSGRAGGSGGWMACSLPVWLP
jgi:hypothetical protein